MSGGAWLWQRHEARGDDPDLLRGRAARGIAAREGGERVDTADRRERGPIGRVAENAILRRQLAARRARDDEELRPGSARRVDRRPGHGDVADLVAVRGRQRAEDV